MSYLSTRFQQALTICPTLHQNWRDGKEDNPMAQFKAVLKFLDHIILFISLGLLRPDEREQDRKVFNDIVHAFNAIPGPQGHHNPPSNPKIIQTWKEIVVLLAQLFTQSPPLEPIKKTIKVKLNGVKHPSISTLVESIERLLEVSYTPNTPVCPWFGRPGLICQPEPPGLPGAWRIPEC